MPEWRIFVQSIANRLGYHIRRLDAGVEIEDPYAEQRRLLPEEAKVIFEVGAADGRDCARYADLFPEATIYAFEPFPSSFAKIEGVSDRQPRVVGINAAVSDFEGAARFNVSTWVQASSLLRPRQTGSTFDSHMEAQSQIDVAVVTMDAECQRRGIERIDLLKMDAQGAERRILEGARSMLDRERIDLIYTEVLFMDLYEGAAGFHVLMGHLLEKGFLLHNLYELVRNQKGQLAWGDAIFVHKRIAR